jgi:predicted outer membrane repeat protein
MGGRWARLGCLILVWLCLAPTPRGVAAPADAVVGDGTAASCTPAALAAAVAVGGTVTFACGPEPVTITTGELTIPAGHTVNLDGGDLVTLSGGGANRLFRVEAGAALRLRSLALADGAVIGSGGAIYNEGELALEQVTLRNNQADGDPAASAGSGGALFSRGGKVTVASSLFTDNRAVTDAGGALVAFFAGDGSAPSVVIEDSQFANNSAAANSGGAVYLAGTALIQNSTFVSNTAATGGGLTLDWGGHFTLRDTTIAHNQATGYWGGGLLIGGGPQPEDFATTVIEGSTLTGNSSALEGGGIYGTGRLTITQSSLTGNVSQTDGGGLYYDAGYYAAAPHVMRDSLVAGNQAAGDGGGLWIGSAALQRFDNVTFSGNQAGGAGGGLLLAAGPAALTHVTLAGNQAALGASLHLSPTAALTLTGSIVALPAGAANCALAGGAALDSGGANVASDDSCLLTGPGDLPETDPLLGPLADNGGPTRTHLPLTGSPAIDLAPACLATDQRGFVRPAGAACDSGAVEVAAPPAAQPPPPPVELVAAQETALEQLTAASEGEAAPNLEDGRLRGVAFSAPLPPSLGDDPVIQATWVLTQYNVFGLADPLAELQFAGRSADNQHLFFDQVHAGLPVFPGGVAVHLDRDTAIGLSGGVASVANLAPEPALGQAHAEQQALAASPAGLEIIGDTLLTYLDTGLLGAPDGGVFLAWEVNLGAGAAAAETVFVDAATGAVVFRLPRASDNLNLDLEDGNFQTRAELCSVFANDNIGCNDLPPDSANACRHVSAVYNLWRSAFGRDSYDGDGEQIELNISVNMEEGAPNASYGGCDLFSFSPQMVTLDIVGHEFTHAVDANAHRLIYANQSGALDESFADIFGYFADPGNWLLAEGSPAAEPPQVPFQGSKVCSPVPAGRDLSNPPCFGQPDHMDRARSGDGIGRRPSVIIPLKLNDFGAIHTNSGIHNKVAHLLIQGGQFNNYDIAPIGSARARQLFYSVLTNWLPSNATFVQARDAAIGEAQIRQRRGEFSPADVCAVRRAYAAVGIGFADLNCDGIDDNTQPDPDEDGVATAADNCPMVWNPGQHNGDGDALGDACDPDRDGDNVANNVDNCPAVANPGQADWNRNGRGDACDDSDRDNIKDNVDNCRQDYNPLQEDQDGDGEGDLCDPDRDGDGWPNAVDNCPVHRNGDQFDTSETAIGLPADGVGDACDLCLLVSSADNTNLDPEQDQLANPCDNDDDGDGINDLFDNCPLVFNADQTDWNGNGRGFACDPGEQNALSDYMREQMRGRILLSEAAQVPIPVCASCPVEQLPPNFDMVILVETPPDYRALVVDRAGDVIAKPQLSGGVQTLRFQPSPKAFRQGFGAAREDGAGATDEGYYLRFVAAPGADTTQPVDVAITLTEGVGAGDAPWRVFMPTVVR